MMTMMSSDMRMRSVPDLEYAVSQRRSRHDVNHAVSTNFQLGVQFSAVTVKLCGSPGAAYYNHVLWSVCINIFASSLSLGLHRCHAFTTRYTTDVEFTGLHRNCSDDWQVLSNDYSAAVDGGRASGVIKALTTR